MEKPDVISLISYSIASAMLLPIGWYLKANYAEQLGGWVISWFY